MKYTMVAFLLTLYLGEHKALAQLSTFPKTAVIGEDLTFKCPIDGVVAFRKDDILVCYIQGFYANHTCYLLVSNTNFTYSCDSFSYNLTIPGIFLTEDLHGTKWDCLNPSNSSLTLDIKKLYITVPITTVTISSTREKDDVVKHIRGEVTNFTCRTDAGRPPATIQWYLSNENITNYATYQYDKCVSDCSDGKMISSSQLMYIGNTDDSGKIIYCTALNIEDYRVRSMNKTLDVLYSPSTPSITQTPRGPVTANTTITLTCEIKGGNPLANITWHYNGSTPVNSTGTIMSSYASVSQIQLIAKKMYHGFVYSCTGSHPAWTQPNSTSIVLDITYPPDKLPSITQTPMGSIDEGTRVSLTCEVQGGKPLAIIEWQCNGSSPNTSTVIQSVDKTISSIEITVTKYQNGEMCTCYGFHPTWNQNKSSSIQLDVNYPPELYSLLTQTPSGPIVEDTKVMLTCEINGGNPIATLSWQCVGFTPVTPTGILPTHKVVSSIEKIVTKEDNGKNCTCTGQHRLWMLDQKISFHILHVYYSSTIQIANTQPIILVENKTIVLVCEEIDGNPRNASFVWFESKTIIGKTANYTIREAKAKDAGNYTCNGSNGFERKSEAIIDVFVLYSPKVFVSSVTNRNTIAEDNSAVLQCTVQSNPPANIVWKKQGSNDILNSKNTAFQSNLTIDIADCLDTGNYTCNATNIINNEEYTTTKDIGLFVKCSPRRYNGDDQSQNPIVLAIEGNLTISQHIIAFPIGITSWIFKRDENSPETTVYSTSNCSTYNVIDHHICFSRLKLSATDFGLYSVVIINDVGKARFTYNVIPEGKPKQPTNILVACETTSMIVSWRPGFNGGVKQSFNVVLLNSKTQQTQYSSDIMDSNHESTKQYIVKFLTPNTPYIIYVMATNSYGTVRSTENDNCTTGSSLFNSQASNSLGTSVAAAIGTSVFILLVTSLVVFVLRRRRMKNKKEDNNLYQSTQPGTSRQRANNDEHDYSELQTKRMDCNPDVMQANSSTTYEEIGRINDGQIYQNVSKNKKDPLEIQNVSTIYANMNI